MAIPEDKGKVQAIVTKDLIERIDYYAERFEVSQSRMVGIMLEACMENEEYFMRFASSAAVKKIVRAFGKKEIDLGKLVI